MRGIMTLVAWAVVLTVAMNYVSAYSGNTANKSSSHEVKYSQMVEMVEKDQVKEILFKDSTIYITPVDGYTYTEKVEEGSTAQPKSYTQSKETQLTLFTKQLSDSQLLPLLEGMGFRCRQKTSQNLLEVRLGRRKNTFYLFGGKDEGSAALIQGLTLAGRCWTRWR